MRVLLMMVVLVFCFSSVGAQEVLIEPYRAVHAFVSDPSLIEIFCQEQALISDTKIDCLEIIDGTNNGFGQGDLMVIYPTKEIITLMTVAGPLRAIMDSWRYDEENHLTTPNNTSTSSMRLAREYKSPFAGLLSFILKGIEIYYPAGERIQGAFYRDPEAAYIELWGFDKDKFKYREADESGLGETIEAFDLLQIIRSDTVYIADSTLFDAIYIYKSTSDTVYMPVQERGQR